MTTKSTTDEIRDRFDRDVERFSNLETGQTATMDSPLMLELVAEAAFAATPRARAVLDVGCGAGNYTLKILDRFAPVGQASARRPDSAGRGLPYGDLDATLIDLSRPMLDRAHERVSAATTGRVETIQGDIRAIDLGSERFDVILAAMVLHHLRTDDEWRAVFSSFYHALRPGGSIWIVDHIRQEIPAVQHFMHAVWGQYLANLQGAEYRDKVFAYTEKEDTPHTLLFQTELLREVGFRELDVLHKINLFAAFGARKGGG